MKHFKRIAFAGLAIFTLFLLTGCGGGNDKASSGNAELVVALNGEPRSLDPAYNYEVASFHVVNSISDGLLAFQSDGSLVPSLAESWEAVDATTYKYQIRQGVKFSDGSDLTVEDVLFSLKRITDPALASDENWMYANVDSITQTGDWEVTVKLKRPDATWQYVPATSGGQIVSKAYVEEKGESFGKHDGGTLGTGPYKLESWTAGSQIVLTRNEHYWNEAAGVDVDKVTINIIPEESSIQLALESGQADFAIISTKAVLDSFADSETVNVHSSPSISNTVLSFNTKKAPFNDVNVRKAIASAVDSTGIVQSQFGEYGKAPGDLPFGDAGYTLGSPESWIEYNKTLPDYTYNIEKAKNYLAQSAYPNGFKTWIYYKPNPIAHSMAQVIQASLKDLNIEVELRQVQLSEYYAYAYGGKITNGIRDYEMGINDWSPDFPDPVGHLIPQYSSINTGEGGSNFAAYSNPKVDALIDRQNNTTDPEERAKLIQEAFTIAANDAPYKYLAYPNNSLLLNKRFDYDLGIIWIFGLNYKDVKLAQ